MSQDDRERARDEERERIEEHNATIRAMTDRNEDKHYGLMEGIFDMITGHDPHHDD